MKFHISGSDLRAARHAAHKNTIDMARFAGKKTRKTYENWEKNIGCPQYNDLVNMLDGDGYDFAKVVDLLSNHQTPTQQLNWFVALRQKGGASC